VSVSKEIKDHYEWVWVRRKPCSNMQYHDTRGAGGFSSHISHMPMGEVGVPFTQTPWQLTHKTSDSVESLEALQVHKVKAIEINFCIERYLSSPQQTCSRHPRAGV
jgi:hypothetical protein